MSETHAIIKNRLESVKKVVELLKAKKEVPEALVEFAQEHLAEIEELISGL